MQPWCAARIGAGDRSRTDDILLGRQMLYQLSYTRASAPGAECRDRRGGGRKTGGVRWDRTTGLRIMRPLLYP